MTTDWITKEATDITKTVVKESINLVKKAWSIMDAASEKPPPAIIYLRGLYKASGANHRRDSDD